MPLTLRRAMPDDYDAFHKGEIVGRIYRIRGTEAWRWTVALDEPTGGMTDTLDEPTGGMTDTLDEAKAALREAWGEHG